MLKTDFLVGDRIAVAVELIKKQQQGYTYIRP
jgi:intracellular sulfur oxidation DsrE/DsrF family protein